MITHRSPPESSLSAIPIFIALAASLAWTQPAARGMPFLGDEFHDWQVVTEAELGNTRGGFVFSNGAQIEIGIRRAGIVGNFDQFRTQFDLADNFQNKTLSVIYPNLQMVEGNFVGAIEVPTSINLIQNTLDNQVVRSLTIVDVGIQNLGTLQRQSGSFLPSFQEAIESGVFR